jgi:hypothetical protein
VSIHSVPDDHSTLEANAGRYITPPSAMLGNITWRAQNRNKNTGTTNKISRIRPFHGGKKIILEKPTIAQQINNFPTFMGPEGPFLYSQGPASGSYEEPI